MDDEASRPPNEDKDNRENYSEELVKKLAVLPENSMRHAVLTEYFSKLEDGQVLEVISDILNSSTRRIPHYAEALKTLTDVPGISQALGASRMASIYSMAQEAGLEDVVAFLAETPAMRIVETSEEEVYVDHRLKEVSLGMKRSLARKLDLDLLNRLLHEQHPMVIENILNNPHMTEAHVVRIASKRPTSGNVLKIVARHPKWISRYRVKKALVFNPFTPTAVSVRLVGFLLDQDLKEVITMFTLHPEIRQSAKSHYDKKRDS